MFVSLSLSCLILAQAEAPAKPKADDAATAERQAALKKLEDEVNRQINRYVRGDLQQKQQVIEELLAKGPEVLDVLPPVDANTSADRKQLMAAVRPKLEKQLAESFGKATLVSVKGEMPLSQALESLRKQSGNAIADLRDEAADSAVKVDVAKMPFWQALDGVIDTAGLTTNLYSDQKAIGITMRPEGTLPNAARKVAYSGPFRIEATDLFAKRNLRQTRQTLQMDLEVAWETRLSPISVRLPMSSLKVKDDQGNSLVMGAEGAAEANAGAGNLVSELHLPLTLPDRSAKKIASLQGSLEVLVPGRTNTFKFEKIKSGDADLKMPLAAQGHSGVQVILHRAVKNGDVWEIGIVLRFENAEGALASHRDWYFANETYLVNAEGKRIEYNGNALYRRTENEAGIAYSYDLENGPDGLTLIYKTPTLIMNLAAPFEIKDIDLP